MKKTAVYLVTGFLGSGKTTFLKQAINSIAGKKKMAVVQNEFAPANMDGEELRRVTTHHFDLLEINNGSVFCVCLLAGFITSLHHFVTTYKPDILLLEASGLSDPVAVGELFNSAPLKDELYLAGSVCVVDALNFQNQNKLVQRIRHQIKIADVVLINKTDLNSRTDEVLKNIKEINPLTKILNTTYCNIPIEQLLVSLSEHKKPALTGLDQVSPVSGRPDINSSVLRTTRPLKTTGLEEFLNQLTAKTWRTKGYIHLDNQTHIAVQSVFQQVETFKTDDTSRQTELIVMGNEMDAKALNRLYQQFC